MPEEFPNEIGPFQVVVHDDVMTLARETAQRNHRYMNIINNYEMGKWRYTSFSKFIWDNIALTALSKEERDSCCGQVGTIMWKAATRLRILEADSPSNGSEVAEILLYGIMNHYFKALPIVPKIFHKQNNNLHAFGADSVHITKTEDDVNFWLGEAKFYKTLNFIDLLDSIQNVVTRTYIQNENKVIREIKELQDILGEELYNKTKNLLSDDTSLDECISRLHVPMLVLVECPMVAGAVKFSNDFIKEVTEKYRSDALNYFHRQFDSMSEIHPLYHSITFHLILFPVPDKKYIQEDFVNKARAWRD